MAGFSNRDTGQAYEMTVQADLFRDLSFPDRLKQTGPEFDGPAYDKALDKPRLTKQMLRVFDALNRSTRWLTLGEIGSITGAPESSISAQIRNLRKAQFGSYTVDKRRRGEKKSGLWEYRLGSVS